MRFLDSCSVGPHVAEGSRSLRCEATPSGWRPQPALNNCRYACMIQSKANARDKLNVGESVIALHDRPPPVSVFGVVAAAM